MFKKIYSVGLIALVLAAFSGKAQDIQFSQYYASGLYLNPSLAGLETNIMGNINVRSQWRSVSNPFITSQVSGVLPIFINNNDRQLGSAGVTIFTDQAADGVLRNSGALLTGAYTFSFGLSKLSLGLQGGVYQRALDASQAQWGSQFVSGTGFDGSRNPFANENALGTLQTSRITPLFNVGGVYSFNPSGSYFNSGIGGHIGVSASNLNQPNVSLTETTNDALPMRLNVHGGLDFILTENITLSPAFLYSNQAGFNQVNAGLYVDYKVADEAANYLQPTDVIFGGWYRLEDAGIAMIGFGNNAYTFGISYDLNTSRYNSLINNRGALEFSLAVRAVKEKKRKRFDTPRI